MNTQDLSYALAKQVPSMSHGFAISTAYGDIAVESGPLAELLKIMVDTALKAEAVRQLTVGGE